jgi:rhodanese-related sulfurtransferase
MTPLLMTTSTEPSSTGKSSITPCRNSTLRKPIAAAAVRGRVGERNSAEVARVMASYFRARDEFEPVSREELLDRLRCGAATVLDVRPEDEFTSGHLPDALNIPLSQLERRLAELPPDKEIVAYCRGPWCVLSFEAVALLRERGYRARRLEEGFPEWKTAGLPTSQEIRDR